MTEGAAKETLLTELRDFQYTYLEGTPRAVAASRGISFGVRRGERVGLIGPTQSGKSTVVYALTHLLRLKEGQVFHEGENVAAPGYDRAALRRKVGVVFQRPDFQILEDVVGKDVAFGPTAAGVPADETRDRVEESLEAVGLSYPEFRLRYVHALSGGQKRRVALAGVLAMRAQLLVLDEPMAGLDPRGRQEFFDLFDRLREQGGLTMVMCSSSLTEASLLCERLIVLHEGRVVMDGPVEEIVAEADRLKEIGIALPEPVALAREMRKVFPDLPTGLLTEEELEEALLAHLGGKNA